MATAFPPRQVIWLLERWGFAARAIDERPTSAARVVRATSEPFLFDVELLAPAKSAGYFGALALSSLFVPNPDVNLASVNAWNARSKASRAFVRPDGSVRMEVLVPLWLGATEDQLEFVAKTFATEIKEFAFIAPDKPRPRRGQKVH